MTKSANWKVIAALGAACAACCAPLLLPLIGVTGGAGVAGALASGLFGRSWAQLACDAILLTLLASAIFFGVAHKSEAQARCNLRLCTCRSRRTKL